MITDLLTLLGIALLAVVFMALIAPLEALAWYAGWRPRQKYTRRVAPAGALDAVDAGAPDGANAQPDAPLPEASHYIVFLSGIGDPSGRWHYPEETEFLRQLRERLPQ